MAVALGVPDRSAPVGGLAPGEYYAVALDDAAEPDLEDPGMLRRFAATGGEVSDQGR